MVKARCGFRWQTKLDPAWLAATGEQTATHECIRVDHEGEHVCYCGEEKPTEREKDRAAGV